MGWWIGGFGGMVIGRGGVAEVGDMEGEVFGEAWLKVWGETVMKERQMTCYGRVKMEQEEGREAYPWPGHWSKSWLTQTQHPGETVLRRAPWAFHCWCRPELERPRRKGMRQCEATTMGRRTPYVHAQWTASSLRASDR